MVNVYSLAISDGTNNLQQEFNLSSFNFFEKPTIKYYLNLANVEASKHVRYGERKSITIQKYVAHVLAPSSNNNNTYIMITDDDYPSKSAHLLLNIIASSSIKDQQNLLHWIEVAKNPKDFDKIENINQQLNDIKDIMLDNIEKIIERGEKIDVLEERSRQLMNHSETWWKDTKKLNRCCKYY